MIAQLNRAFASGNPARVSEVLGFIAREYGMSSVADKSGMQRTMLYKTLSAEGNPTLRTLMAVMKVLGITMTFSRPPQNQSPAGPTAGRCAGGLLSAHLPFGRAGDTPPGFCRWHWPDRAPHRCAAPLPQRAADRRPPARRSCRSRS